MDCIFLFTKIKNWLNLFLVNEFEVYEDKLDDKSDSKIRHQNRITYAVKINNYYYRYSMPLKICEFYYYPDIDGFKQQEIIYLINIFGEFYKHLILNAYRPFLTVFRYWIEIPFLMFLLICQGNPCWYCSLIILTSVLIFKLAIRFYIQRNIIEIYSILKQYLFKGIMIERLEDAIAKDKLFLSILGNLFNKG